MLTGSWLASLKMCASTSTAPLKGAKLDQQLRRHRRLAVDGAGDPQSPPAFGSLAGRPGKKAIILRLAQSIVRNLQCHMGLRSPGRSSNRVQSFRLRTERPNHC